MHRDLFFILVYFCHSVPLCVIYIHGSHGHPELQEAQLQDRLDRDSSPELQEGEAASAAAEGEVKTPQDQSHVFKVAKPGKDIESETRVSG